MSGSAVRGTPDHVIRRFTMAEGILAFTQNSIRIDTAAGRVYVDPFRMAEEPHDAAFVLVTHEHYDHFSKEDLAKVCKSDTVLVIPMSMLDKVREIEFLNARIETVVPGEKYRIDGLSFETVPAYNIGKPFHPQGAEWVGYIVDANGKRVYVAGDTDATEEAKAVRCDIAVIPIGGKYTMDAEQAAELVNTIRPELAIPVHYGGMLGNGDAAKTFSELVDPSIPVEIMF